MNQKNRLQPKDLINIGIFTAIYFVVMFIVAAVTGFIPILFIALPAIIAIVCGTVYMLFLTKVKKKGMITIMGIMVGVLLFLTTGNMWTVFVFSAFVGIIADLITSIGKYESLKYGLIGYCVFALWPIGSFFPIWLMREAYFANIVISMGQKYADTIKAMTPIWILPVMAAYTIVAALIGGIIGRGILKKHFEKAGMA